jgi:hypothetical protein
MKRISKHVDNSSKYTVNEQMILLDIEKKERKHFINDVLKIDFPEEDKIEYSEKPSENRKRKKLEQEKKMNRPKTAGLLNRAVFKEEELKGDNLGIEDQQLIEEVMPASGRPKKKLVDDYKPTYSTEDFIGTINKIKENPDSFKYTNKVRL